MIENKELGSVDLIALQRKHAEWAIRNFGERDPVDAFFGVTEELGELARAMLKKKQGIRGNSPEHDAKARDAVGDILLFLLDYCTARGWSFNDIVLETWRIVRERDWIKYPKNGRTE